MPVKPFADVAGSAGTVPPPQIVIPVPKLNVGVVRGVTFMVIVTGVPH